MAQFASNFLARLELLEIASRRSATGVAYGRGHSATRMAGGGLEFMDIREYAPGDDVRSIDWNLCARFDKLLVRVYQPQREHDIHILLDVSESMASPDPRKFECAKEVAAALAYIALAGLDRVAIWPFAGAQGSPTQGPFPLAAGRSRVAGLLRYVGELQAQGVTDLSAAAGAFCRLAPSRGVVIVISDFLDTNGDAGANIIPGLRRLVHQGFETHAVQILGAQDVNPSGEMLRLVDAESGRTVTGRVTAAVRERYQALLAEQQRAIATAVRSSGGAFVSTTSAVSLEELVLRTLRRNGILE